MDILTTRQRSHCMSRIRGRNTGPELTLRRALWSLGLRYRLHRKMPGRPDIVFVKRRVAVFVDGCFWHGCPLHAVRTKSNGRFWTRKLRKHKERDKEVDEILTSEGWTVMRYWEHQIEQDMGNVIRSVVKAVRRSAGGRGR